MIQLTPHMRILVAVEPIDFRAGINALADPPDINDSLVTRHRARQSSLPF